MPSDPSSSRWKDIAPPRIETFGEALPHGTLVEAVACEYRREAFQLLVWDGKKAHIDSQFQGWAGPEPDRMPILLVPPVVDPAIRRAIRFPTHAAPYGSTWELFERIRGLIQLYTDLPEKLAQLATYAVFTSWFPERRTIPACVSIIGPESYRGSLLVRLLNCLLRRPLLLSDLSLATLCSLPTGLCPTLFLEQRELTPQTKKVLLASKARDTFVLWKGKPVNLCCTKVIRSERSLRGLDLGTVPIEIPVNRGLNPADSIDERTLNTLAAELQPQLLQYRLEKFTDVVHRGVDPVDDAPLVRESLTLLFQERQRQHLFEREIDLYAIVVEAMFALCHEKNRDSVYVQEVASAANGLLKRLGETLEMDPRSVGDKVRALYIATGRLDAQGRGFHLINANREQIHRLAWDYKILEAGNRVEGCQHCAESGIVQPMFPLTDPS